MKLKDTYNGRVRALLQQGPKSTEELQSALPGIGRDMLMQALRSMKQKDQIHGSHAEWVVADWCSTEEKFNQYIADRCIAGLKKRHRMLGPAPTGEDIARAETITRGVNMAMLSWR